MYGLFGRCLPVEPRDVEKGCHPALSGDFACFNVRRLADERDCYVALLQYESTCCICAEHRRGCRFMPRHQYLPTPGAELLSASLTVCITFEGHLFTIVHLLLSKQHQQRVGQIIVKQARRTRVDYRTDALNSVTATVNQNAQVVNTYRQVH